MPDRPVLYYITDRTALAPDEPTRRRLLLERIAEATRAGVDYIQLREKDLSTRELESLAREAVIVIAKLKAENPQLRTALLINSRTDVALAAGADGVHLRADDVAPGEVSKIWARTRPTSTAALRAARQPGAAVSTLSTPAAAVAVSCHSPEETASAADRGATFAVFAPVFEKKDAPGTHPAGLAQLGKACRSKIPVLALGGVTLQNAKSCLEAGAAGIAAIRLFQENDIAELVGHMRSL